MDTAGGRQRPRKRLRAPDILLIVLAAAALLIALLASPEEFRAVCRGFADRADGWLGRLEALWQSVRETLDRWGEREMARRNPAEESGEAVSPVRSDAPERS